MFLFIHNTFANYNKNSRTRSRTHRQTNRETYRQADTQTVAHTDTQTHRHTDRHKDRNTHDTLNAACPETSPIDDQPEFAGQTFFLVVAFQN
jgi:hypothetical protein